MKIFVNIYSVRHQLLYIHKYFLIMLFVFIKRSKLIGNSHAPNSLLTSFHDDTVQLQFFINIHQEIYVNVLSYENAKTKIATFH